MGRLRPDSISDRANRKPPPKIKGADVHVAGSKENTSCFSMMAGANGEVPAPNAISMLGFLTVAISANNNTAGELCFCRHWSEIGEDADAGLLDRIE